MKPISNRRNFLKQTGKTVLGSLLLPQVLRSSNIGYIVDESHVKLCGHLWVYASKFPPNWDCTPVLDTVFQDMAYAGLYGVELMEVLLRPDDAVRRIANLKAKHNIKVSGSSYGVGFQMCDAQQHKKILEDIHLVVPRLAALGGETFGISVGSVNRLKTEKELDAQAHILKQVFKICQDNGIQPNLHNYTYEVENDLHDLKGTLARLPDAKLGPDLNWLIRAGVSPVDFINTYGDRIVYLHIRDQYADGTWTEYVGQGDTDFKAIAQALEKQKFSGKAAIELAFPNDFEPENPLKEDWKMSREFVQETFGW
ncbi:sugar phosphate isomerase/epimerase family protein [Flagellimonas lutaonensis]|nr:sugar phosphate isomerase/epimerase [Allomuricauda lutaonensis]